MQQAQDVTFTVTAPLMSAGINTGLSYLSQKPRKAKRKNQRATATQSHLMQDHRTTQLFSILSQFDVHSNIQQWKQVGKIPEINRNSPGRECYRTQSSGVFESQAALPGTSKINKSLFFIPVGGNVSWHPSDDKPFFPATSASSVTMATASSAMTSHGFPGNCSQSNDVTGSPWQCSMRPGRKYLKWEDRSERTKEGSGKSRIKDN